MILYVLADLDIEYAYRLLENEEIPGWLSMPKNGAMTIWEAWEGPKAQSGIASLNHYSKGAVAEWLFASMCGIRIAGENRFVIAPRPGGQFTFARASYRSVYGTVNCGWRRDPSGGTTYSISVPANCEAELRLPGEATKVVGTGEYEPHGHRILAYLIDVLVMFIPNLVLEFAVGFVLGLILGNSEATKGIIYIAYCVVGFLVIAGYEGLTHCNTVGKRTMKLAVVFDDIPQGTEIPFDRAMKRGAAKWLSGAICGIGLLMAFFSQTHQALHDQLCKCQVVKMD